MNTNDYAYLAHHGVKGMKWGVRRYQNYDGSYTQAGLRRYYNAEEKYNEADSKFQKAKSSGDKNEISKARGERANAKAEMSRAYDKLKQDKKADQGKKLYAQGNTIGSNDMVKNAAGTIAGLAGSLIAGIATQKISTGKAETDKLLTIMGAASIATAGAVYLKKESDNRKIRAYYAH